MLYNQNLQPKAKLYAGGWGGNVEGGGHPVPGKGLQNSGFCPVRPVFEQGRTFIVPHLQWRFFAVSPENPPHSTDLKERKW